MRRLCGIWAAGADGQALPLRPPGVPGALLTELRRLLRSGSRLPRRALTTIRPSHFAVYGGVA